jgi:hypothetical protein
MHNFLAAQHAELVERRGTGSEPGSENLGHTGGAVAPFVVRRLVVASGRRQTQWCGRFEERRMARTGRTDVVNTVVQIRP